MNNMMAMAMPQQMPMAGVPMNAMSMGMGMPMAMQLPMHSGMNGASMGMGMPMMMPMMMPMPMMCRMTAEMTKDGMVCKMIPTDAAQMTMMSERCSAINAMMAMGMPVMVMCGGMPMLTCIPA